MAHVFRNIEFIFELRNKGRAQFETTYRIIGVDLLNDWLVLSV